MKLALTMRLGMKVEDADFGMGFLIAVGMERSPSDQAHINHESQDECGHRNRWQGQSSDQNGFTFRYLLWWIIDHISLALKQTGNLLKCNLIYITDETFSLITVFTRGHSNFPI